MARRLALVTGAGKGIGQGIARTLIDSGYDVVAHYCHSARGARALGPCAYPVQADLSSCQGIGSLFAFVRALGRPLHLMVYNSGLTVCKKFLSITADDYRQVTDLDWHGGFFCTQMAAQLMAEGGVKGHIVLITSNQAHMVYPDGALYGSVKAALAHFCRCAAVELAPYGIRVNAIAPGYTDTGDPRMGEKASTYGAIPMGRWCTPEEIGQGVLYLDGPWAGSITGTEIMIDGGGSLTCKDDRPHE